MPTTENSLLKYLILYLAFAGFKWLLQFITANAVNQKDAKWRYKTGF